MRTVDGFEITKDSKIFATGVTHWLAGVTHWLRVQELGMVHIEGTYPQPHECPESERELIRAGWVKTPVFNSKLSKFLWVEKSNLDSDSLTPEQTYSESFEKFMSKEFDNACKSSTCASWTGGSYSVELFADGTYRVKPSQHFGNLYNSPGEVLVIPALSEDEYQSLKDSDDDEFYMDNVADLMRYSFENLCGELADSADILDSSCEELANV